MRARVWRPMALGPARACAHDAQCRHWANAKQFLSDHLDNAEHAEKPFFLYYPANSNHSPYTPDKAIEGRPVLGAAKSKAGKGMSTRYDFIYENDVALGLLMDFLESTNDPRSPGSKLSENTIVVFTSDNGAESKAKVATGPLRSNKGSAYEGGHRVPYIVAWPAGGVGNGDAESPLCVRNTHKNLMQCRQFFKKGITKLVDSSDSTALAPFFTNIP